MLAAHTPNCDGHWHSLKDHLLGTAERAARFADPLGLSEAAWWAGFWHDIGKASLCTFQPFLALAATDRHAADRRFPRRDRSHKGEGARLAFHSGCDAAAFAIFGHHGGLPSKTELRDHVKCNGLDRDRELHRRLEDHLGRSLCPGRRIEWPAESDPLRYEMRVRMLASCLVDADFLDTESHFDHGADRSASSLATVAPTMLAELGRRFPKPAGETGLSAARSAYRTHVVARAKRSAPGFYRMTGRTGVGKTFAGMAAAVEHAMANGQRRVVIAVPYTTVTEQTADALRSLVVDKERVVLEHHSAVEEGSDSLWRRLASENWDAPVVVTTTVQLFDSLFARSPSRLRKLHRLAGAVIVIDEAQTLPGTCLAPMIDALDWLVTQAGATVVFQTATQPAFDLVGPLREREIPDWGDIDLGPVFDRVRWSHAGTLTHGEVAERLATSRVSAMCVVNSVRDAHSIAAAVPGSICLTTRLCSQHRRLVLAEVGGRLERGERVVVVATQMVEAGVDLDFPAVWRAEGPLPSLAQAAGRCNRGGLLPGRGAMTTFELVDGDMPSGEYAIGTRYTTGARGHFGDAFAPEAPEVLRWWYHRLYGGGGPDGPVDFDAKDVDEARRSFDYPETARRFRMIDHQIPLVVDWGPLHDRARVDATVDAIRRRQPVDRSAIRHMARFCISVRAEWASRHRRAGYVDPVEEVDGHLRLARWTGAYDERLGVVDPDGEPASEKGATQW